MTVPLYQYLPLTRQSSIRVLQLQPAPTRECRLEARIRCLDRWQLESPLSQLSQPDQGLSQDGSSVEQKSSADTIERLDEPTEHFAYEAVSYAWGPPDFTERLIILPSDARPTRNLIVAQDEDSYISITPSVDTMLRTFRSRDVVINLWIDAICLDQSNRMEIGQQVANMVEIYGDASRTRVWWGAEDDHVADVFKIFRDYHREADEAADGRRKRERDRLSEALARFFKRPWFSRRWVLQEIVLSWKVVCYAFNTSVPYDEIEVGVRRLWHYARYGHEGGFFSPKRHNVTTRQCLRISRVDLLDKLYIYHELECSDPKDKLLAFRGLCEKDPMWTAQQTQTNSPIWWHYMPWQDVFKSVSQYYITDSSCQRSFFVHIAAFGSIADSDAMAPSWCPDWTRCRKPATDFWLESEYANDLGLFQEETGFGCMFDDDGQRLLIRQHALEVASLASSKKYSIMNASGLAKVISSLLPDGSEMFDGRAVARLTKFLDLSEGRSADEIDVDVLDPRNRNVPTSEHNLAPSSFEALCDALFPVLHKYDIFATVPYVTRKPDGVDHVSCGIGLCYRGSIEQQSLVLMSEQDSGNTIQSEKTRLFSPLIPLVSAEGHWDVNELSHLSQAQLDSMKQARWNWDCGQAFVGRVAGCVCMAFVNIEPSRIGNSVINTGIPQRDMVIV